MESAYYMMPHLLLVGASVRAAAQAARRLGLRAAAVDFYADDDLIACCGEENVAQIPDWNLLPQAAARWAGVPWMYCGGLENRWDIIERLCERGPLLGNGTATRGARDPERVASALLNAGISSPAVYFPSERIASFRGAKRLRSRLAPQDERQSAPGLKKILADGEAPVQWLRKPLASCGGLGITSANADREPLPADDGSPDYYYQEYVAGTPASALYVADGKRCRLLGISEQLIGRAWRAPQPFMYAGSLATNGHDLAQLSGSDPLRLSDWQPIGECLTREFNLQGIFGVDAIVNKRGVWPIEVNPRFTASAELYERTWGVSPLGLHLRAAGFSPAGEKKGTCNFFGDGVWDDGESLCAEKVACPLFFGKLVVYAERPSLCGERCHARLWRWARENEWPAVADIPRLGTEFAPGQPVATVFAEGPSRAAARRALQTARQNVLRMLEESVGKQSGQEIVDDPAPVGDNNAT